MKEKLCKFLRPRLAVLLAALLLAAYLPAMPAAQAAGGAPTGTWEEQEEVRDHIFEAKPTALTSYTYSKSDGTPETVTVDPGAELGSKKNPISIPNEAALILFGKQKDNDTQGKYYILDKPDRVYDMGAHTMRPLMGEVPSGTGMPDPSDPFQGVLIGNGARIENVYINIDGESALFGLFGSMRDAEVADLTVSLTSASAGSSAIAAGGLVGVVRGSATLTNCTAEVSGSLAANRYAGGLVGGVASGTATLTDCTAKVSGNLAAARYAGGLVGGIEYGTATLKDCTAEVAGSLTADISAGGLVGFGDDVTLTNCTATVSGSLAADNYVGGLVGAIGGGTATLTDCAAQAVITKPAVGSYAPSGPVGDGPATFSGANVTTLRMGASSSVYLALVNNTTLTLDDSSGGLKATGSFTFNGIPCSVEVTRDGGAVIQVRGGSALDGRTYTLTGVNGTLRLENKTGETTPQYWVTADASFSSDDTDPLAKGDKVDLLGAADNRLCTVAVKAGTGGSVSVTDSGPVSVGTEVIVTATPENGYRFVNWTENGKEVSTEASYTFIVAASRTLTAVFERQNTGGGSSGGGGGGGYIPPSTPTYPPTVERPSSGGGAATVSPSRPERGDTVTVTPKPDDGYEVDTITVTDRNGRPVEVTMKPDGTYTFQQPSGKVTIEVTYQPIERPWNSPFADVSEGDWYYEAVRFVQERGLMNGYSDGQFGPNNALSRAQLAQILFNKEGRPGVNYLLDFSDVASEAWYTEAIRWTASQGIVGGYGNGTFGPNDPITREQLAVMLWRYSKSPAATNKELHFNDESEISGFALEAMRWAVENGILNGDGDGRLGSQGQATRAQVAQMLKNFIENQEDDEIQ